MPLTHVELAADHIMRTAQIMCSEAEYLRALHVLFAWKQTIISRLFAECLLIDIFASVDPLLGEDVRMFFDVVDPLSINRCARLK